MQDFAIIGFQSKIDVDANDIIVGTKKVANAYRALEMRNKHNEKGK